MWLWIVVIVGFFTFSAAKQDLYIFPIVPAVAALAGLFIARETRRTAVARPRSLQMHRGAIGLLLALAGAGTLYIFQTVGKVYALDGAGVRRDRGRDRAARVALVLALAEPRARGAGDGRARRSSTLNWAFVIRVLPSFERYKPVPPLSAAIRERLRRRRRGRALQRRAPEHGLLPAAPHRRPVRRRTRSWSCFGGDRRVFACCRESDYAQLQPVPACRRACSIASRR